MLEWRTKSYNYYIDNALHIDSEIDVLPISSRWLFSIIAETQIKSPVPSLLVYGTYYGYVTAFLFEAAHVGKILLVNRAITHFFVILFS